MPADITDDDRGTLEGADADFGFGRRKPVGPARLAVDPLIGATVGDVRLESLIGEGGMGRVYLGRQERPDRPVAVKIVKPGMLSAVTLRRFERESDVLGRLQHAGITQVHRCGTVSAGGVDTAYFVMEYVAEARSITDYAAARELTGRQRLELFCEVCDAVIHAHARGILHRDLKPGNILISADGRPKIIDFGVARSMDSDTILTTGFDDIGRLVGTIPYMAPEQFRGDSSGVGVRSDVYALGVVLYELLAGRPPFDLRQAVLAHAARVVLEEEPPPLSSVDPRVGRDIGRVVAKCLEKDPQRRYASVFDLASDVGRFMRGEAVLARAPSPRDWVRRLWRRHAVAIAFAAGSVAVLAALAVSIAASRWGASPARPRPAVDQATRPASTSQGDGSAGRPRDAAPRQASVDVVERRFIHAQGKRLTLEDAAALADEGGDGHLEVTLEEIDPEIARVLATSRKGLSIIGIRDLSDDVAAALGSGRGGSLNIDPVERLSRNACESLAGYGGWLNMNGVQSWPEGGLEAIVQHRGGLSIRVTDVSRERARVLARHRGNLYVVGVERLDEDAARELVAHVGTIDLANARGITPAAAAIFRQRAGIRFPEPTDASPSPSPGPLSAAAP